MGPSADVTGQKSNIGKYTNFCHRQRRKKTGFMIGIIMLVGFNKIDLSSLSNGGVNTKIGRSFDRASCSKIWFWIILYLIWKSFLIFFDCHKMMELTLAWMSSLILLRKHHDILNLLTKICIPFPKVLRPWSIIM